MLYRYTKEKAAPSFLPLARLASAANIRLEWLATGEGSPDAAAPGAHRLESADLGADYAMIPLYDVQAAAGHGAVVEDQQATDALAFKKQWIHRELHANPGDLYLIHVVGESMEPTLAAGDIILVDHRPGAQGVTHDGIYVLRMDGGLLVKRLQRLPGHRIKLSSDNSAYDPFELSLDSAGNDLQIIGRVVWSGRRM